MGKIKLSGKMVAIPLSHEKQDEYAKLAELPNLQIHYVNKTGHESFSPCLPTMRPVYSFIVNMLTDAEFYANTDEEAIEFARNHKVTYLTKVHHSRVNRFTIVQ